MFSGFECHIAQCQLQRRGKQELHQPTTRTRAKQGSSFVVPWRLDNRKGILTAPHAPSGRSSITCGWMIRSMWQRAPFLRTPLRASGLTRTALSSSLEKWRWLTHVDIWSVAQEIQRKGVKSEINFLEMAKRDSGRRIWPVSLVRHPVPNEASSNAVKKVLDQYPWVDSGLQWKGTMVFKESPGEDRSALFESTKKPGVNPLSGPPSSSQDASTSSAPPAKAMPSALTKAETPAGKATSSGRPASEPDIKVKGDGTTASKPSTPLRATSESGITDPTKKEDTSASPKALSTTVSVPTSSPKPSSSVVSMQTTSSALPKAKASSEAAPMSAPPAKSKVESESEGLSTSRAPSGAASQSSVTVGSGYPTIAESLSQKKGPPLKAAPSSKTTTAPSTKSEDTGHAAAKGSTLVSPKGKAEQATTPPSMASTSQVQEMDRPARAPRAPAVLAPVEKDAAMSYTEQVMKQAASARMTIMRGWPKKGGRGSCLSQPPESLVRPRQLRIFPRNFEVRSYHLNRCSHQSADG